MSLRRAGALHGSLRSLVSLNWSNTLGNAKSFLNKKDRLFLSGLIDILFLPPVLTATEERVPRRGFCILSNYSGKWTVQRWFFFFPTIPSIMIISLKSSFCFLITWFKNKVMEAKVKLGSWGVGGFSEYVVWNAGLSWKWDNRLEWQAGGVWWLCLLFGFLLLFVVYIKTLD